MKIFGKYLCMNCGESFKTGAFLDDAEEKELYDDICPYCGAPADETFLEWIRYNGFKIWLKKERNIMKNNEISIGGGGVGFCGFLTLIFITLKLTGQIDWSWWWVLSPIWIPVAMVILIVLIVFLCACIAILFDNEED